MPDQAVHYYFGQSVLAELPSRSSIDHPTFDFALSGPDDWFYDFPDRQHLRRGPYMHRHRTGVFLRALASQPSLKSYFAGFACHYVLDSTCHPYIIARTGFYDKTEKTRSMRGNHTALERAIDRWILREYKEDRPHAITDSMLGAPLPSSLKEALNEVYRDVFGWNEIYDQLLTAKKHMRRYLRLLEDPHGIVKGITAIVRHPSLQAFPYSREFYRSEDVLNLYHREWQHPYDPSLTFTDSFPDLLHAAQKLAVQMITAAFQGDLSLIGDRSYLTGFELDDPRNQRAPSVTLLKK